MRNETRWGPGIIGLVVAGAALGVLYNAAGLVSHPKRGIPWLAATNAMANLDTLALAPPDSEAPVPDDAAGVLAGPGEAAEHATADPPPATSPAPTAKSEGAGGAASRSERAPASKAVDSMTPAEKGRAPAPAKPAPKTASASAASPGSTATTAAAPAATQPDAAPPVERRAPPPFIPESDRPVRITLAVAKSLFDAGAALFMDARDPSDYEAGHIPGALRMTRDDALEDPDRIKALPVRGRPIVAYCSGGVCEASLELAQALVDAGYRKVLVYSGGFPDWEAAGYPVKQGGEGQ
jgi:rhodanese-related sulfurtransferase